MFAGSRLTTNGIDAVIESNEREETAASRKRRKRSPLFDHGIVGVKGVEDFVIVVASARDVDQALKEDKE